MASSKISFQPGRVPVSAAARAGAARIRLFSADGQTISGTWAHTDGEGPKTSVWSFKPIRG